MDTASQRFIVEYNSRELWGELRGFLCAGRRANWILGSGIGLVMAGTAAVLWGRIGDSLFTAFCVGAVLLPVLSRMQVPLAGLRAYKHIILAQAPQELLRPVLIGAGILVAYACLGSHIHPAGALGINTGATLLVLLLGAYLLRRVLPDPVFEARPVFRWREWFHMGFSLMATDGFYLVIAHADIIMIGAFLGTEKAGIYAVASRLAALISFGILAVNTIVAPLVSELATQDKQSELKAMLRSAAIWTALISVPIAVLLVLVGPWVLGWFGPEFVAGYPVLIILAVGQTFPALTGFASTLMNMTGYHGKVARIVGITAGLNVVLNAVAIPLMGMWGAAVVSAVTTVAWNTTMLLFVVRKLGINPTMFQRWK
jgi:O-antigen/teichoic acid export membrane protein